MTEHFGAPSSFAYEADKVVGRAQMSPYSLYLYFKGTD